MADQFVQVAPNSTGLKVDTSELTVGANVVERQRTVIADDATAAALAKVQNAAPAATDYGLTVRLAGTATAAGAAASGAAISGNPVPVAASDGTNARYLLADTSGRLAMTGAAASGSAAAGNPVLIAGSDGTNARSLLVDASGRLTVVGVTGSSALFMQGAAASGAAIAGNPLLMAGTFTTTLPTVTTGQAVNIQTTARGEQLVAISSGATAVAVKAASTPAAATDPSLVVSLAGANSATKIGDGTNNAAVKAASTAAATTDPAMVVGLSPNMATTAAAINSAASTNATSIKASAGTVFSVVCSNTGAAAAFVKLYNLATAPTVGTSTPIITISIPASGTVTIDFGTFGYRFATGIALAITNLAADTDTTAVAAAQVKVLASYV